MIKLIPGIMAVALAGCSVSPAPLLTIPKGHPGSAESSEAPYEPPPNPFKQDVPPATPPGQKGEKHTVLKVRDNITTYEDPDWYQQPPGTSPKLIKDDNK